MTFLRLLGACFLVAGAAVWLADPALQAMGIAWLVTGAILVGAAQLALSAAAREARILATGRPGRATLLEVAHTGVTLNRSPRVRVRARIEVPGEPPVEASRGMFVPRFHGIREGGVYEVRFDPARPDDFVFAPEIPPLGAPSLAPPPPAAPPAPEDRIGPLERLADLRDRGALTPEEFEAEKRAILERR